MRLREFVFVILSFPPSKLFEDFVIRFVSIHKPCIFHGMLHPRFPYVAVTSHSSDPSGILRGLRTSHIDIMI